jgi:hypothetical protein
VRFRIPTLLWLTALVAVFSSFQRILSATPIIYYSVVVVAATCSVLAGASGRSRIFYGGLEEPLGVTLDTVLYLGFTPPRHWLLGVEPAIVLFAFLGALGGVCVGTINAIGVLVSMPWLLDRNQTGTRPRARQDE